MSNKILNDHVNFTYTNAAILDPFVSDISKVTLNKHYLPLASYAEVLERYDPNSVFIEVPEDYLTAKIELYYKGAHYRTIPLLFTESVSESLGTNYVKESPIGSSNPIVAFSSSAPSTINVSFVALADYLPTGYKSFEDYIDTIRKLTKPQISGDYISGPEVLVTIANLKFHGVCDSVSIEYQNVYGKNTHVVANITCQFTRTD